MSVYNHFLNGVTIRGIPITQLHPGKVFFVNNSSVLADGGIAGSDSNDGSLLRPYSTIDYAIGRCTAGRGDIIAVMPGHAESITAAGTIAIDVSGVAIVGIGAGELRPILTATTATTANVTMSGANTSIKNIVFKCGIASQVNAVLVTAKDVVIDSCEFRDGAESGLNGVTIGAADNDADRTSVVNCKFYMPGSNTDHAIEVLFDMIQLRMIDNEITGDFDEGGILLPAAANACLDIQIKGGVIRNTQTNIAAISVSGTTCTGVISNVLLVTDTLSTALDNGSLATDNVRWADETDQVSAVSMVLPEVDSATNFIGVDDANNVAATTNVAANRDGSILERLEAIIANQEDDVATNYIGIDDANNVAASSSVVANVDGSILERLEALMDPLSGYNPRLGFRVTKVSNLADGSGTDALFTVTGRVLITSLTGEVTTVIGGAATMKLTDTTNTVDLCAATTIDSDAVGTMYALTNISTNILNGTGATPVVGSIPNITGASQVDVAVVGDVQAALTIAHVLDAADTGAVTWRLTYIPLVAGATVAAAA